MNVNMMELGEIVIKVYEFTRIEGSNAKHYYAFLKTNEELKNFLLENKLFTPTGAGPSPYSAITEVMKHCSDNTKTVRKLVCEPETRHERSPGPLT